MEPNPVSLDSQSLLRESAWVRQLANLMVRDAHLADDLSQEVLLRAWQRSDGAGHKELEKDRRSWIRTVLLNLSRMHWRSKARREERESLHAGPTETPSSEEAVRRAELQQQVVQAVLQLAEPYRTTVLLRHLEEHSVEEVAERMGVPPSTVRVRCKRALEQLQRSLIAECDADPRAYLTGMSLLAGLRQAGPGGGAAPLTNLICGSQLMLKLTLGLAAVVAVWSIGILDPLATRSDLVETGLSEPAVAPPNPSLSVARQQDASRSVPAAGGQRQGSSPGATASDQATEGQGHGPRGAATLSGRVIDSTGGPLEGVSISIFPQSLRGGDKPALAAQQTLLSDANGAFESADLTGFVTYGLQFEKTGFVTHVKNGFAGDIEPVRLHRAVSLTGQVLESDGITPVASAKLLLAAHPSLGVQRWSATSASDGSFEAHGLPAGMGVTVEVFAGGGLPSEYDVPIAHTGSSTCKLVLRERSFLDGLVVDFETGAPVPHAGIFGGSRSEALAEADAQGRFQLELDQELMDAATYDQDITPHDQHELKGHWMGVSVGVRAEGYVHTSTPVWQADPALGLPFRVPLLRASTTSGTVHHADGRLAEGVLVAWDDTPFRDLGAAAWARPLTTGVVRTDAAGRYELTGIPAAPTSPGVLTFRSVDHGEHVVSDACPARIGMTRVLDVVLGEQPLLTGSVYLNGAPTEAYVYLKDADGKDLRGTKTDSKGRFVVEGLPPGSVSVEACTADGSTLWSTPVRTAFPPQNDEPLRVVIVATVHEVRGRVLGTDGEPLGDVQILAFPQTRVGAPGRGSLLAGFGKTDSEGYFRVPVNPDSADQGLTVTAIHHQSTFERVDVVPDAEVLEFFLPAFTTVELLITHEGEAEVSEVRVRWSNRDSGAEAALFSGQPMALSAGGRLSVQLPIGLVDLEVLEPSTAQRVTVEAIVTGATSSPQQVRVDLKRP